MLADPGNPALDPERCAGLVTGVTDDVRTLAPVRALREELIVTGISLPADSLERMLLRGAAVVYRSRIEDLPVHSSVRNRIREEFAFYSQPAGKVTFEVGSYLFTTGCKVLSLRRFPAGPMDWEISGIPRSWLLRMPKLDLPRVALFLARSLGGLFPLFFMHVARRPKNRSLLIEKEVLRAYYRMAQSMRLQPHIRGIMASAWFHDPAVALREPHLAFMNRIYLDAGGLITTTGPAPPDSGFLEHNAGRAGSFTCRLGLTLWPRRQALEWADSHPEFED